MGASLPVLLLLIFHFMTSNGQYYGQQALRMQYMRNMNQYMKDMQTKSRKRGNSRMIKDYHKEQQLAEKERINEEKMWLMQEKELLFWMQYQRMMALQVPLQQLKNENVENKFQLSNMYADNQRLKLQIMKLAKETAMLKAQSAIKKSKK